LEEKMKMLKAIESKTETEEKELDKMDS